MYVCERVIKTNPVFRDSLVYMHFAYSVLKCVLHKKCICFWLPEMAYLS